MASFREYQRRTWLPLALLGLGLYYFLVFVPLSRRSHGLDEPLQKAWRSLTDALDQTNATVLDFRQITNRLADTRQSLAILENAKELEAARLELPASVRARLDAPFQLVDYQYERSKQIDDLNRAAAAAKIPIAPAVFSGFPEHTVDIEEPALLWAALAFTDNLLDLAVRCKVSAIHSLDVPMPLAAAPPGDAPPRWTELPVQVEFSASAANALELLQSLPLRADELGAAGSPGALPGKIPLYIQRLVIRKESPDKLDEVRVRLRVVGFVRREG
jgi:hypothetical protein